MSAPRREVLPPSVLLSAPGSGHAPTRTGGAAAVADSGGRFELDAETRAAWDRIVARYPKPRAAVMGLLHDVQDRRGWIPSEAVEAIAKRLSLPDAQVWEVVTFYPMYRTKPGGRHAVAVCHNIACDLRGARGLLRALRERYGISPGETTRDGALSLETVECLASCGTAPVADLDGEYHENLTAQRLLAALDALVADKGGA